MSNPDVNETVSALVDGQLHGDAFARAVEAMVPEGPHRDTWLTYHLVGDVLRSPELARGGSAAFMAKFSARLAQEPAFAIDSIAGNVQATPATTTFDLKTSAANDVSFRWKMVAGFASLAAVGAIGWTVLVQQQGAGPQLAAAPVESPAAVVATSDRGVMIRDARLDELLSAHRQFGGASALPMPAGFHNAAMEGPAR